MIALLIILGVVILVILGVMLHIHCEPVNYIYYKNGVRVKGPQGADYPDYMAGPTGVQGPTGPAYLGDLIEEDKPRKKYGDIGAAWRRAVCPNCGHGTTFMREDIVETVTFRDGTKEIRPTSRYHCLECAKVYEEIFDGKTPPRGIRFKEVKGER